MSEKPTICIQPDVFWEDTRVDSPTTLEVARRFFHPILYSDFAVIAGAKPTQGGALRGALNFARQAGYTFNYANALKWLPKFREKCVNNEAYFTDLAEAVHIVSHEGGQYIRPVEPFKEFSGQVFDAEKLRKEIAFMQQNKNIQPDEVICAIAPPKYVAREWRCIFVDGKYVSGSQYAPNILWNVPFEVQKFAEQIASDSYFANVFNFVIDIGVVNGELALVEVNGFETASFYASDLEKIYEAWQDFLTNPEKVVK